MNAPPPTSFAQHLLARKRPWKRNLMLAASYSAQAVVASAILLIGRSFADSLSIAWAIISAIIAIQPGLQQSFAASLMRIVANIVGAAVGLALGEILGVGAWQTLIGIVIVVALCQFLRLDDGLRIACIAVVIVLYMSAASVEHSAVARSLTVIIGCSVGTMVQFGAEAISRKFGVHDLLFVPAPGPITPPAHRNEPATK
ncbi:MAG: FUSC family protein [Phycisphaeraceae bacterium]|nr:FUSC family protein [Phycisphaeraceae bacterium]